MPEDTEATLTETEFVLSFMRETYDPNHRAEFSRPPDEPGDVPRTVLLEWEAYVDFGRPDHITVTIVPGDTLNEGG